MASVRHPISMFAVAFLLGMTLTACGEDGAPSGKVLTVKSADTLRFDPPTLTVKAGETVRIRLDNAQGKTLHDFTIDRMPTSEIEVGRSDEHAHGAPIVVGTPSVAEIHIAAEGGKTAFIEFVPTEPGRYAFYCSVTGHREGGMEGIIVVEA